MAARRILFIPIFLLAPAAFADGPFGVSMGISATTLPGCAVAGDSNQSAYVCKSLPKAHPAFERFILFSSKDTGVCKVVGIGKQISDNGNGDGTRAKTDELAQQIALSYGQWTDKFDLLHVGALFTEPGHWLMALKRHERDYNYAWIGPRFAGKNAVQTIMVESKASSMDTGYVAVAFEFTNFTQCKAAMTNSEALAF